MGLQAPHQSDGIWHGAFLPSITADAIAAHDCRLVRQPNCATLGTLQQITAEPFIGSGHICLRRDFVEELFEDKFAFLEESLSLGSPGPKKRRPACKTPILASKKASSSRPLLNWTRTAQALLMFKSTPWSLAWLPPWPIFISRSVHTSEARLPGISSERTCSNYSAQWVCDVLLRSNTLLFLRGRTWSHMFATNI